MCYARLLTAFSQKRLLKGPRVSNLAAPPLTSCVSRRKCQPVLGGTRGLQQQNAVSRQLQVERVAAQIALLRKGWQRLHQRGSKRHRRLQFPSLCWEPASTLLSFEAFLAHFLSKKEIRRSSCVCEQTLSSSLESSVPPPPPPHTSSRLLLVLSSTCKQLHAQAHPSALAASALGTPPDPASELQPSQLHTPARWRHHQVPTHCALTGSGALFVQRQSGAAQCTGLCTLVHQCKTTLIWKHFFQSGSQWNTMG